MAAARRRQMARLEGRLGAADRPVEDAAYRESVLPRGVRARVAVEAGISLGWDRWVGDEGAIVGLDHFGASAPAGTVFKEFGFTVERVTDVARRVVREGLRGRIPTLHPGHLGLGGEHPSLSTGDPGVDRSDGNDPGHS